MQQVISGEWASTAEATQTQQHNYTIAASEFGEALAKLRTLLMVDLKQLEEKAEIAGAPWTPGRFPTWKPE